MNNILSIIGCNKVIRIIERNDTTLKYKELQLVNQLNKTQATKTVVLWNYASIMANIHVYVYPFTSLIVYMYMHYNSLY